MTALYERCELARDERGSTAVEFALLALPFFTVITAILETSIVFLASQVLESAVNDSSRLIRTGQAQSAAYTIDEFRDKVCQRGFKMFTCDKIKVRVRLINDFASAGATSPLDPIDDTWLITEQFEAGVGSSIIIAEAYYKWPTVVNLMGFNLANSEDNTRLLGAVRVWRNEPFGG